MWFFKDSINYVLDGFIHHRGADYQGTGCLVAANIRVFEVRAESKINTRILVFISGTCIQTKNNL